MQGAEILAASPLLSHMSCRKVLYELTSILAVGEGKGGDFGRSRKAWEESKKKETRGKQKTALQGNEMESR